MAVYLDHAASTPVRPEVAQLIAEHYGQIGNASSVHSFGQKAKLQLEAARDQIAAAIFCHPTEVVFTSGGTEANNLAIFGLFQGAQPKGAQRHGAQSQVSRPIAISSAIEHHAVLEAVDSLPARFGATVQTLPVDHNGIPDRDWFEGYVSAHGAEVGLMTLMLANNETGVLNPVEWAGEVCRSAQIPFHTDAVAAIGHTDVRFNTLGADTMALAGHKIGAPVGTGALIVGRKAKVSQQFFGGSQERAIRPGTQDVLGAQALALAVELAVRDLGTQTARWEALRNRLVAGVVQIVPEAVFPGMTGGDQGLDQRLSNILNVVFPGCRGDSLLFLLDSAGVAISNGSACTAGVATASHVLLGMGFSQEEAAGAVRVSFGIETTEAHIDAFLEALAKCHPLAKAAGV